MKFSKEFIIGLMAIVAIGGAIWGYKYLKGQNALTRSQIFKVRYDNVDMLEVSAPVYVSGYQVGTVSKVELDPTDMNTIIVTLDIESKQKFHRDTEANIISLGIMGQRAVQLMVPSPCTGELCAESGDFLEGRLIGMVESMLGEEDVESYLKDAVEGLGEAFDTLNARISDTDDPQGLTKLIRNLQDITENLSSSTKVLDATLKASSRSIVTTSGNLEELTNGLKGTDIKLSNVLDNVEEISTQVKEADLGATIKTANTTLEKSDTAMEELNTTLQSTTEAMDELSTLLERMNAGEGTLGKLARDEALYERINELIQDLDIIAKNLGENPEIDVNLGLFGGKKDKKDKKDKQ